MPRGPMIDGIASTSGGATASRHGCWPARGELQAGYRSDPRRGGTLSRAYRDPSDSVLLLRPPFCPDAQGIDARPRPVEGCFIAQPVEQRLMESLPDRRRLPVAQPPPAGRATAAAQLLWEPAPGATGPQHKDDAAKGSTVWDARATALGLWRFLWQQGFDGFPEVIGNKGCGVHDPPSCHPIPVLKHGLR